MSNDAMQPVAEISISKEHLDEWVVEMEARIISHATRSSKKFEKRPSIFGKWQCWDDFGASFIPETQKWHIVACMTHWFGINLRSCLQYMQEKEDLAWSYYRGVDEKFCVENSKLFIEHLLVQSCFLIFAIVFLSGEEYSKVIVDKMNDQSSFPKGLAAKDIQNIAYFLLDDQTRVKCYMLTMNYQIPWFVVVAVYTEFPNLIKISLPPIHKIALSCFNKLCPREHPSKMDGSIPEGGFKHLLHIFHWSRTPDGKYLVDNSQTKSISRLHIPSATKLRLSQIVFKKDEGGSIDMSYSDKMRLSGVMQLTPWYLSVYNTKRYESLIRFEEHCGYFCGLPFTAYIVCMSCLLKTEADVRVLRANGIFPNTSFDDKDVLRCVQELRSLIPGDHKMPNELFILQKKVMEHHKKSVYRVIGEFKKRYCSNTWIIISVIAGILLFVLTFLQTLYGMLSYYNQ